jgi:predicted membrane protein (TIGR00267 family)
MKTLKQLTKLKTRFYVVAGFSDGLLTALTLAGGKIINPESSMTFNLALRVGLYAAITGVFIYFLAHYQELRNELAVSERQLNLTPHGRLASSRLGRAVFLEAAQNAFSGGFTSFCGALLPLAVGVVLPGYITIAVALVLLFLLGIFIARYVNGNAVKWGLGLLISGAILTFVGMQLNIV